MLKAPANVSGLFSSRTEKKSMRGCIFLESLPYIYTNKQTQAMKWNYNNVPSTSREVLVAFRTNNGVFAEWDKHVHYTTAQYEQGYGWSIPQNWEFLAWSDFDRLKVDGQGNRTEHNKLDVVGLGL